MKSPNTPDEIEIEMNHIPKIYPSPKSRWVQSVLVSLLNLSGLSLGYIYLGRRILALLHIAGTLGLIILAYILVPRSPKLVILVLTLWLSWMVFHAAILAYRQTKPVLSRLRMNVGIAILILAVEAVAVFVFVAKDRAEFSSGLAEYQAGNCLNARPRFYKLSTFYRLTFDPNLSTSFQKYEECSLVEYAHLMHAKSDFEPAYNASRTYLHDYPSSPMTASMQEETGQILVEWAAYLSRGGNYGQALDKYQILITEYPQTPSGGQAHILAAQTYAKWAEVLASQNAFGSAMDKYYKILDEYPSTPAAVQAPLQAADLLEKWALQLTEAEEYESAVEKYETILTLFDSTPNAKHVYPLAADIYISWAKQLHGQGKYDLAIEKYLIILDRYADTKPASQSVSMIVKENLDWAEVLRKNADYKSALERYQIIEEYYADEPGAQEAGSLKAQTYFEWGDSLNKAVMYELEIDKYQEIVKSQIQTDVFEEAQIASGRTYISWGIQLHGRGSFTAAMDKFTLARNTTQDDQVQAQALEGYENSLYDLSQATTGEGQALLNETKEHVCFFGDKAGSLAIASSREDGVKALDCGSGQFLPTDLRAVKPAHFFYVLLVEESFDILQVCFYKVGGGTCSILDFDCYAGSYTLTRQRQWTNIQLRSTVSGKNVYERKFFGSSPSSCPQQYSFGSQKEYLIGTSPSIDDIIKWITQILK